jgi:hypothetical protein
MHTNQTRTERDCVRRTSRSTLARSKRCGWVCDHSRAPQTFVSIRVHSWLLSLCVLIGAWSAAGAEIVIDFEQAEIGKPVTNWVEKGVTFTLAHQPKQSRAAGRVMFFPHLATSRKGILCAMANEQIPVEARFPGGASSVTLKFWGSTGCPALLEAFDGSGQVVDKASVAMVPGRTRPEDPIPFFELTVKAARIAYVQFSGPRTGEYLAADELRFTPIAATSQ